MIKPHSYWDKKPTLRDDIDNQKPGSIEGKREVKDVRKEPLDLPKEGLYWADIDLLKEE